jgi:hypothetical protein
VNRPSLLSALRLAVGLAAGCLLASTWPLWTGSSSFPQVPFARAALGLSSWADTACLALILLGLGIVCLGGVTGLTAPRRTAARPRAGWLHSYGPWTVVVGLALSAILNQHRLQPWVWHFLWLLPLISRGRNQTDNDKSAADETRALAYSPVGRVLVLTASLYLWSAWSKLDATFATTYGQHFVEAMLNAVGLSSRFWPEPARVTVALLLPLGELLAGVLILLRRTRCCGLGLAIAMHFGLLLAVGPAGLNHEPGVLIWNLYFVVQNLILILCVRQSRHSARDEPKAPFLGTESVSFRDRIGAGLLGVVILFPSFRIVGNCDVWPAWAVYASQPARATVLIEEHALPSLPAELHKFVQPRRLVDGRVFLRIDLWSIEATGAPIYPGERFATGVALWLSDQPGLENAVSLVIQSEADWWTQKRESTEVRGRAAVQQFARRFRLNTQAREVSAANPEEPD